MVRIADLESGDYWKHMGMTTVPNVDGKTQVVMKVTEQLKQFYGNVHGGVLAGLLDSAIAVAVNERLDSSEGASTVELKLNYLRPVNEGTLWAEGKIIQKGRRIIVGQGEIKDDSGNLVAFGTATFMVTQLAR
ncbi:PaaI family thioesterase [Desulfitobacterium sp.]|uniref:PaaI family thioesterase n=1 Tax=Desulfitobacterium sp. TaxID=49981 RepID=UPI002C159F9F|nr:PaaI family thioesterase [Desulfitobacterium sp.]HVJ47651.1 PaaI family thioesterase [Desulfitobacterium sp.]